MEGDQGRRTAREPTLGRPLSPIRLPGDSGFRLGVNPLSRNACLAENSSLGILKCQQREFTMSGGILEDREPQRG